jgi:hypothetical protein
MDKDMGMQRGQEHTHGHKHTEWLLTWTYSIDMDIEHGGTRSMDMVIQHGRVHAAWSWTVNMHHGCRNADAGLSIVTTETLTMPDKTFYRRFDIRGACPCPWCMSMMHVHCHGHGHSGTAGH